MNLTMLTESSRRFHLLEKPEEKKNCVRVLLGSKEDLEFVILLLQPTRSGFQASLLYLTQKSIFGF